MQNKFLWFFKVGSCIFLKCWDWNLKKFPRKCWNKVKLEKYPSRGVFKKRCSENMLQIYRRTSMPKCYFNKVTEIILRHGCSPVNLQQISEHVFLRTPPENGCFWNYNIYYRTLFTCNIAEIIFNYTELIFCCCFLQDCWALKSA